MLQLSRPPSQFLHWPQPDRSCVTRQIIKGLVSLIGAKSLEGEKAGPTPGLSRASWSSRCTFKVKRGRGRLTLKFGLPALVQLSILCKTRGIPGECRVRFAVAACPRSLGSIMAAFQHGIDELESTDLYGRMQTCLLDLLCTAAGQSCASYGMLVVCP